MIAGTLACAYPQAQEPPPGRGQLEGEGPLPRVFVEARPQLMTAELFGALRERGVAVWIASDRRLGVRVLDASQFEPACELLAALDHDIESIDLSYLPIDDLGPLMNVRSTERLDLTGARAQLRPLRHLTRLRVLSLAATDFDSLAPLAELDRLEQLDLSSARADLIRVGQLPALRELQLSQARTAPRGFEVRDGEGLELAGLRDLTELEMLGLSRTKVRDWAPLATLWTLRRLDLSYTNFQDLGLLERFAELETLVLRRTAVADLTPLLRLDSLTYVDLRDCELIDEAALRRLMMLRPDLEVDL